MLEEKIVYPIGKNGENMDEKPDLLITMMKAGVAMPKVTHRPFFVFCPFHDDRTTANMRVDPNQGVFYCHACGAGGDAFSFVGLQLFGSSFNSRDVGMFNSVIEHVREKKIPRVEYRPPSRPKELTQRIVQTLTLAARVYHLALMGKAGEKVRKHLQDRKIDIATMRKCRLGYAVPGALMGALAGYPPTLRKAAEQAGLYIRDARDKPRELLSDRIVFPDIMRNGSVRHMLGRSLDPNTKAAYKYFALSGLPKTIWGLGRAVRTKPVILTESTPDAVNLFQMNFQGAAVGGTGISSYLITDLAKFPDLIILPQNDERGIEAVQNWKKLLPKARVLWDHPYTESEKDLNDQVRRYGLVKTREILLKSLSNVGVEIGKA